MQEEQLRSMIAEVKSGTMDRRAFIQRLAAYGLAAPMASQILLNAGVAQAQTKFDYKPTKRGGGGLLKLLWWQAPTLLNPHFAVGTKDQDASRLFYEPLAAFDSDANLVPILASEIPTRENGGLSADGKNVIWKIKPGVKWHDGKPLTVEDVIFTWEFNKDPATATVNLGSYRDMKVEKVDDLTVKITFDAPVVFWAAAYVGNVGMIIPKHLFGNYTGAKGREAPANIMPVGTGPYKCTEFKPGDIVKGVINTDYHMANRPHFDAVEMKGGGDAVSAARAVIQTGEYDFAWNMQVEDEILIRLEQGGKGNAVFVPSNSVEFICLNSADPNTEIEGERSHPKSKHPAFSDPAVRKAMGLLIDRESIQKHIYGRAGVVTPNYINLPKQFNSPNTKWEYSIEKAAALLDAAGWKPGPDGVRAKDGKRLKFVFQTSTNSPRQKAQAIVKQSCQKAGIDIELKSVVASVFFSTDVANPDTTSKFYADMQMFTWSVTRPDPAATLLQFVSWEVASKSNNWQRANFSRWTNEEYDKTYKLMDTELDPAKRAAHIIKLNDLMINDNVFIPIIMRPLVQAVKKGSCPGSPPGMVISAASSIGTAKPELLHNQRDGGSAAVASMTRPGYRRDCHAPDRTAFREPA
ncbi:MAG: peptide ABC transporter substrate-binding protein [Proteobacteria bacterium]|nr:peptide ABC transporter substrate-binding protein [Pseudomonadota bacterium]